MKDGFLSQVEGTPQFVTALWRLGHSGFVVKSHNIVFYINPCLRESPLQPAEVKNADMILCTDRNPTHMDPLGLADILAASPRAKLVLPKSEAAHAFSLGVPYERMTTTDNALRVEYFKDGHYGRVYAVPARPAWTPATGYPSLGYLIRFGGLTIYHAGDCAPYEGLVDRLRPYNVTVALMSIGENHFSVPEAARLAEEIGCSYVVPINSVADVNEPGFQNLKVGERWVVPAV